MRAVDDAAITMAIIDLSRRLSLTVVAEGVETPDQHAFLREKACDLYQGYLASEPVPARELERMLGGRRPVPRDDVAVGSSPDP